jgi:hypothetical protein
MAKKENNLYLGISETEIVNEYMQNLQHPLADVAQYVRKIILKINKNIGEGIYWNAPTFYYTGSMKPFLAKDYKRYIVGFVFNKQDCIRLVFLHGANAIDKTNILEGDFKDGRKLLTFTSIDDVKAKEKEFIAIVKSLVNGIDE